MGRKALVLIWIVLLGLVVFEAGFSQDVADILPHACPVSVTTLFSFVNDQVLVIGAADINCDGFQDIVAAGERRLRVLIRTEDGAYREEFSWGLYPTTNRCLPLCGDLADLDSDGWPDVLLAVLDTTEKAGWIYAFQNRQGIFESAFSLKLPFTVSTPGGLYLPVSNLYSTDLNSDGKIDILLIGGDPENRGIYCLFGEKGFSWKSPVKLGSAPGRCFAFDDFDGDGVLDLGFYSEIEVTVFYGDGIGGFAPETVFGPLGKDERIKALSAADMDGDGDLDLVLCLNNLLVALQEGRQFQIGAQAEVLGQQILLRDFNGDGTIDVLVESGYTWKLIPGDGKGGLLGAVSDFLIWERNFAILDIDGDSLPDFCSRGPTAQVLALLSGTPPKGESRIPFNGNALLAVGDLSGDNAPDLVTWSRTGMEVFWNNGRGGLVRRTLVSLVNFTPVASTIRNGLLYCLEFEQRPRIIDWKAFKVEITTLGKVSVFAPSGKRLTQIEVGEDPAPGFVVADLDANGTPDILCLLKNALVVVWDGVDLQRYPWDKGELSLAWAESASPGVPAQVILVSTAEYPEIWKVMFSQREMVYEELLLKLSSVPLAIAAGDLDGDGQADPVFACLALPEREGRLLTGVELALVLSKIGPTTYFVQSLMGETPWPLNGVAAGDFNGDGFEDLALSVVSGRGCFLLPGRGDGTFGEGEWILMVFHSGLGPIFGADLDGNGQEEIVSSTSGLSPHLFVLWNGGGR